MSREEIYKINKFEKPEKRSYQDIKKFDVVRTEYGDFDNWITVIILDLIVKEVNYGGEKPVKEVEVHFADTCGMEGTFYSPVYNNLTFDVVGKAVELKKEQSKDGQEVSSLSM